MTLTRKCDWCSDNACKDYWILRVFDDYHRICNCCYKTLRKENQQQRDISSNIAKEYTRLSMIHKKLYQK